MIDAAPGLKKSMSGGGGSDTFSFLKMSGQSFPCRHGVA